MTILQARFPAQHHHLINSPTIFKNLSTNTQLWCNFDSGKVQSSHPPTIMLTRFLTVQSCLKLTGIMMSELANGYQILQFLSAIEDCEAKVIQTVKQK